MKKTNGLKKIRLSKTEQWLLCTGVFLLLLMTLSRIAFLRIFPAPGSGQEFSISEVLFLGLRFDARVVAVTCLLIWLLSFIPAFNPFKNTFGKKLAMTLWLLFLILSGIFYSVDFANYAYLNERLNAGLLNYVADTQTSARMIWETYPVLKITGGIILLCILGMAVIKLIYRIVAKSTPELSKGKKILSGSIFFLLLAFLIFGRVGQYPVRWSDAFTLGNDYASNAALNPFQSFVSSLQFRNATYDIAEVKKAYPLMAEYLGIENRDSVQLNYTRKVNTGQTPVTMRNVVIVICESFSMYKSSMSGNPLNTTPYFAELCRQGVYFDRCFTPSYGTARVVWTTITGTPDVALTKTSSRNPSAVSQHTIINDFKGYEKFYFIGGSLSWANIRGILTNNIEGLHLYEQDDYKAVKVDVWGISDKNLLLSANKILAQQSNPFIAVIQTADNHRPYTIPEEDKKEFELVRISSDSLKQFGFESLDELNAFRYTDYCFRKFMEAAQKESYFDNTLFVFVGDHGIGGDVGALYPRAWTLELSSEHVPLLFYAPKFLEPGQFPFNVSQADVLPTAAGICRIPYTNTTLGRDLLSPLIQDNPHLQAAFIYNPDKRRIGIVKGNYFYSRGIDGNVAEQMYSTSDNSPVIPADSLLQPYRILTKAWYETARYLLLNNKTK